VEIVPHVNRLAAACYSAFLPGACDLPDILRARGLDTVLIAGTVTNVCCESSARDAMQLNLKTVMVTDANAAVTDEEHAWSLISFYNSLGDIMSTDMAIACLRKNAAKGLAAAE
jgi:ureidoacrylate peracid hydrolase